MWPKIFYFYVYGYNLARTASVSHLFLPVLFVFETTDVTSSFLKAMIYWSLFGATISIRPSL